MKKIILSGIAIFAIAALATFNVNINTQENGLSDISLSNIEALASEGGSGGFYQLHCGSSPGTQCQSTLTGPSCPNSASCPWL